MIQISELRSVKHRTPTSLYRAAKLFAATTLLALMWATGQASPVTLGSFTFEQTDFADTAVVASGSFNNQETNIIGFTPDVAVFANPFDAIEFGFTDNTPVNGPGYDILAVESADPERTALSRTLNGPKITAELIETIAGPRNLWGFDLSNLGFATNEVLSSTLILWRFEVSPEVAAVAAINNLESDVAAPGTLPLIFSALGLLQYFGFRVGKKSTA